MRMAGELITLGIIAVMIYLFLRNGDKTIGIIKEMGGFINTSFKTLQGR